MEPQAVNRRDFLAATSAAALLAAMHPGRASAAGETRPANAGEPAGGEERRGRPHARLAEIEMVSTAPLAAMKVFYGDTLGLPVAERDGALLVEAGASRLLFRPAGPEHAGAFYHFAFNIPENKLLAARDWQLARTPLIPAPERLRDPAFPADVIDYSHWNAHSLFFWDPAGNIVEHIARHDLANAAPGPFSAADLLCVSEIAFISDDVPVTAARIRQHFGLENYRGESAAFTAVGDEHGLLLVMERGRLLGFEQAKPASVFPTRARINTTLTTPLEFPGSPFLIGPA